MTPLRTGQAQEARRRKFIWEHHPDRGGDPAVFIAGLRTLDADRENDRGMPPVVVVVRRRAWLVRRAGAAARRLRCGPPPPRVR